MEPADGLWFLEVGARLGQADHRLPPASLRNIVSSDIYIHIYVYCMYVDLDMYNIDMDVDTNVDTDLDTIYPGVEASGVAQQPMTLKGCQPHKPQSFHPQAQSAGTRPCSFKCDPPKKYNPPRA